MVFCLMNPNLLNSMIVNRKENGRPWEESVKENNKVNEWECPSDRLGRDPSEYPRNTPVLPSHPVCPQCHCIYLFSTVLLVPTRKLELRQ